MKFFKHSRVLIFGLLLQFSSLSQADYHDVVDLSVKVLQSLRENENHYCYVRTEGRKKQLNVLRRRTVHYLHQSHLIFVKMVED